MHLLRTMIIDPKDDFDFEDRLRSERDDGTRFVTIALNSTPGRVPELAQSAARNHWRVVAVWHQPTTVDPGIVLVDCTYILMEYEAP